MTPPGDNTSNLLKIDVGCEPSSIFQDGLESLSQQPQRMVSSFTSCIYKEYNDKYPCFRRLVFMNKKINSSLHCFVSDNLVNHWLVRCEITKTVSSLGATKLYEIGTLGVCNTNKTSKKKMLSVMSCYTTCPKWHNACNGGESVVPEWQKCLYKHQSWFQENKIFYFSNVFFNITYQWLIQKKKTFS